ncbi:F-box and leucine-rich repeat protein 13 [Sorex fumeus]|uniref:F-box and leucine-rich repeat protein 13 n=1 Tax=Sorex fumeus TaxID=62283 RepID=UPI0024AE48E7|nr:F-box and leucine-rich repeat protein 13 [Sorex fumeus]
MSSLRNASPSLKNYFKKNYIPQVCEALLCGILINRPEDPLKYLEAMIIFIRENGLQNLLWDMCIDPLLKPTIRRLSETYMEQLFGLDDQLMTPELMIKACTFYTGHLIKTHFATWRDTIIPTSTEDEVMTEKMRRAEKHSNLQHMKHAFYLWYSYTKSQKENARVVLLQLQKTFIHQKLVFTLHKWKNKAKEKRQLRDYKLQLLNHELQLSKWRSKLIIKSSQESILSDKTEVFEFDISQLPEKAILQIFFYLTIRDVTVCGQVSRSWLTMTQMNSLWHSIDFSAVKTKVTEKCIVSTLQRWRLNVLRLNFRGCHFRLKTLKFVSFCKNLQELNVSDCPELTDEAMRYISENCPGILYLNLSNTDITNRTMRLLPRHFHNLQNLSLAYCRKFTDKGLRYLSLGNGCHKLIYLDLSGCTQISVQGFKNIANSCSGIKHLTINDMPTLTDNCVKALVENCSQITSVVFTGAPHISDCTFQALSTCNLRKLRIEGNNRITDESLKSIDKHYPHINHLYMADCREITDGALKSLSLLRHLTVLNLANCVRLGDVGLRHFLDGPSSLKIRELNLSNCTHLGDASIIKLSECCLNLRYLSLRNCDHLTDTGLQCIARILSLISVDISGTKVTDESLEAISTHKKLKEISLSECYRITCDGIQAFCKGSSILDCLDVSYYPQLSDDCIKALTIYCINLTFLSIAACPKITDAAMELLSAKCPYLHILDVSGCILLTDRTLKNLQIGCKQLRILKMKYCRLITPEAVAKISSVVQQVEYSSYDPPLWFSYSGKEISNREKKEENIMSSTGAVMKK